MTEPLALPPSPLLPLGAWLIDLRQPLERARDGWQLLDPQEQARALRFRFEHDFARYCLSHAALRQVLSRLCDEPPASVRYAYNPHGKPSLIEHRHLHFNLSHSRSWALIGASSAGPIGVDIEDLQPVEELEALVDSHFGATERAAMTAVQGPDRLRPFLRCWTRKEACLKAIGCGLDVEPGSFEAGTDSVARRTAVRFGGRLQDVDVHSVDLPVDAIAACAARAP